MKAILVNADKSLSWADVADPAMGDEDCLVKIEAAGLNRADLMQREGNYPPPPGCPEWMGLEIAGTIVDMGETARKKSCWKIGDRVCALLGGGGYAQFVNVKYDMFIHPLPPPFLFSNIPHPAAKINTYPLLRSHYSRKPASS